MRGHDRTQTAMRTFVNLEQRAGSALARRPQRSSCCARAKSIWPVCGELLIFLESAIRHTQAGIDASPRRTDNVTFNVTTKSFDERSAIIRDVLKRAEEASRV
jgi:hypothetical protein